MLVEPIKDLLDAFVIRAVNRLFTVATVENQHFEPWERRCRSLFFYTGEYLKRHAMLAISRWAVLEAVTIIELARIVEPTNSIH